MRSPTLELAPVVLVLTSLLGPAAAQAQSRGCDQSVPYLGTAGPEICVAVRDDLQPTPSEQYFRGPSPLAVVATVGEYDINMVAAWASSPLQMTLDITGTVTRSTAGNSTLVLNVNGGWGTPLLGSFLSLNVVGFSTGTSLTQVGASAGVPVGTIPAQDLVYTGSPVTLTQPTNGGEAFGSQYTHQVVIANAAALGLVVAIHINNVGDTVSIPAGAGIAPKGQDPFDDEKGGAGGDDRPHFECYSVDVPAPIGEYNKDEPTKPNGVTAVTLEDQFDYVETRLGRITRICTPVSKNEEGIPDPELHLVCYEIEDPHDPKAPVETTDQFGKAKLVVRESRELCVPASKKRLMEQEPQQQPKEPAK